MRAIRRGFQKADPCTGMCMILALPLSGVIGFTEGVRNSAAVGWATFGITLGVFAIAILASFYFMGRNSSTPSAAPEQHYQPLGRPTIS